MISSRIIRVMIDLALCILNLLDGDELLNSNLTILMDAYSVFLWTLIEQMATLASYFGLGNQTHRYLIMRAIFAFRCFNKPVEF